MREDGNFDLVGEAFEADVYGTSKGLIRLEVLWHDLLTAVPRLTSGGLKILDAGGGAGHLAIRLAQLGHQIVLAEPARDMRERAETSIGAAGVETRVTLIPATLQQLGDGRFGSFDVVICHAVLEWLADPRQGLLALVPRLAADGQLSLLFYNRNAALLKRVLRGDVGVALRELDGDWQPRGWGEGCVPLAETAVRAWLAELDLVVRSKAGVRIFHDHVPAAVRGGDGLDALLRLEHACSREEPFASLGQHTHLTCERMARSPN